MTARRTRCSASSIAVFKPIRDSYKRTILTKLTGRFVTAIVAQNFFTGLKNFLG